MKNTVAERAAAGTPTEGLLKDLKGTNSIAYTKTDPVALAKILTKVAKDVPAFQFRAGWVEGRVISIQEIGQLAQLPSKEELISKIMFMLNAPAQRVATGYGGRAAQSGGGDERSGEGRQIRRAGSETLRRLKQLNRTNFSSQEDRKQQWLAKWKRFSKKSRV